MTCVYCGAPIRSDLEGHYASCKQSPDHVRRLAERWAGTNVTDAPPTAEPETPAAGAPSATRGSPPPTAPTESSAAAPHPASEAGISLDEAFEAEPDAAGE